MYWPSEINNDDLEAAILSTSQRRNTRYRAYVIDAAENFEYDLTDYLLKGSVAVYAELRGRSRAAQIELANPAGMFSILPTGTDNIFWYDSRFKLEYLIEVGDEWVVIPLGIFMLDEPRVSNEGNTVLNMSSKMSVVDNDVGTNIVLENDLALEEAIRRIVCKADHQCDGTASAVNSNLTYSGSWSWVASTYAYDSGYRMTSGAGNEWVEYTAYGKQATALFTMRNDAGIATIAIDGVDVGSVDCYAAGTTYRQHLFNIEFPYGGQHTIRVTRSMTKNPSSSGTDIPFDGFQFLSLLADSDLALEETGRTLGKRIPFFHDQNRLQCLKELVDSYSLILFEDGDGKIRLRNYQSFRTLPIDWYYEKGTQAMFTKLDKVDKPPRYNHVVVVYGGAQEAPAYQERRAEESEPSTPFATTGPLGDRVKVIKDNNISGATAALNRAKKELEQELMVTEEISFDGVCNPLHEPYDKIHISEVDYTKVNDEYSLESFTIPLETGRDQKFNVSRRRKVTL